MKKLFTFNKRKDSHLHLRFISKVFKVFYIVIASVSALTFFIYLGQLAEDNAGAIIVAIIFAAILFFITLFVGFIIETLLLGFSNIVENNYEELTLKNKGEEDSNSNNSIYEKIKLLSELKNLGIINEEEYDFKKNELLKSV